MQIQLPSFAERLGHHRIPVLDGVRAAAVLIVIASHVPGAPARLVSRDLGVTLFFVLSGFLITWLLLKEWEGTRAISYRAFLLRRMVRIVPAYYAFLLVWFVAYSVMGRGPETWQVAAGAGYTVNYLHAITGHPVPGLEHAWSLAVEEQFYLLWPPLLAFTLARGGRRRVAWVLALMIAGVFAWRSYLVLVQGAPLAWAYNAFDTRFDALAVGCLVAAVAGGARFGRLASALGGWTWLPLVPITLLVAWHAAASETLHHGPGFTVDAVLAGLLLVQVVMMGERGAWRVLSWAPVRFVGKISYPLYLYHPGVMALAGRITALPVPARVALGLALSTAAACASWWLVERPFLRLKERLSQPRPSPLPHTEPALPLPSLARVAVAE